MNQKDANNWERIKEVSLLNMYQHQYEALDSQLRKWIYEKVDEVCTAISLVDVSVIPEITEHGMVTLGLHAIDNGEQFFNSCLENPSLLTEYILPVHHVQQYDTEWKYMSLCTDFVFTGLDK